MLRSVITPSSGPPSLLMRLSSTNTWDYRRVDSAGIVEFASWRGAGSLGLRPHFHDETQIVLLLSGSRTFWIDGAAVTVRAGDAALIPAGTLHAPIAAGEQETRCLNAYVPPGRSCASVRLTRIGERWRGPNEISPDHVRAIVDEILGCEPPNPAAAIDETQLSAALMASTKGIGAIAAGFGQSREGFSRMVRRKLGVSPHAFRVLARLNLARQLLRQGKPVAAVAADTGFADQSHLTRLFRRTFGTTPGIYRRN